MPNRQTLAEARPLVTEAAEGTGRFLVQLISPGIGSSAYYPAEVLESAARNGVWPSGTHIYLDHPSATEAYDRPERSVRDLAGVLTEDARWDGTGLVAEARVYAPYRPLLAEMAEDIGMSIRATATVEEQEVEGRRMPVVTELHEGLSVDFVTHAGRGGRVLQVLESARHDAALVAEALPGNLTADDLRRALRDLVRGAYGGDESWTYVQDFTDEFVYFTVETEDGSATYQQTYAADTNGVLSLSGDRTEVRAETRYVPVAPAGQSTTTTESQEDTMPQIEEARLRQLEADAGRVQTLESERSSAQAERDTALRALAEARARTDATQRARARVAEANRDLAPATIDRIVATATATVPLTEAGQLDVPALEASVDQARTAEETYLASLAEGQGAGTVRGLGSTGGAAGVSEADLNKLIAGAFGRTVKEA